MVHIRTSRFRKDRVRRRVRHPFAVAATCWGDHLAGRRHRQSAENSVRFSQGSYRTNRAAAGGHARDGETPFYCLLEADRLITRVSVETDRLLEAVLQVSPSSEVALFIRVQTRQIAKLWATRALS